MMVAVVVAAGIHMWVCVKETNRKTLSSHCLDTQLHVFGLELTFAGRHAPKPLMIKIFVACTSAVLKPSTTRSATTVSAGFLEHAAFGARHRFSDR